MDEDLIELESKVSAMAPAAKVAGIAAGGLIVLAWVMGGRKPHPFLAAMGGAGLGVAVGMRLAKALG